MQYLSTRDISNRVSAAGAIVKGIAQDGGLFVPETFPQINPADISHMAKLPYEARSAEILSHFLTDYTKDEINACVRAAYAPASFGKVPAPLMQVDDLHMLELWHGPTHAFKDMALQLLPHLMVLAMKKTGTDKKIKILVATSGDTGKAALEGFKDVDGTSVLVFYPKDGVSPAQRLQMLTQEGENLRVCAVEGNFDDAHSGVKRLFSDPSLQVELAEKGIELSSANSINWGRLVPQIAYYFSAYADLIAAGTLQIGQHMNVCVPTGNFGNILAAYYAKRMGLPIGKLLCASNKNNILFDFIQTGSYDTNRPFYKTSSPSMDILISSNLERLLFELCERDDEQVASLMKALKDEGRYEVPQSMKQNLSQDFYSGWAGDEDAKKAIKECFDKTGYAMDPHTAVGYIVAKQYMQKTGDTAPMVVVSTASPYKFSRDVLGAIKGDAFAGTLDEFACADALEEAIGLSMPRTLRELKEKPLLHGDVVTPDGMRQIVLMD